MSKLEIKNLHVGIEERKILNGVDLVVNATSVSDPDESNELAELTEKLNLPGCDLVVDLNYGRARNFWKEMASRVDTKFMDGLCSLAFQARRTFALWTGIQVPPREFLATLNLGP